MEKASSLTVLKTASVLTELTKLMGISLLRRTVSDCNWRMRAVHSLAKQWYIKGETHIEPQEVSQVLQKML